MRYNKQRFSLVFSTIFFYYSLVVVRDTFFLRRLLNQHRLILGRRMKKSRAIDQTRNLMTIHVETWKAWSSVHFAGKFSSNGFKNMKKTPKRCHFASCYASHLTGICNRMCLHNANKWLSKMIRSPPHTAHVLSLR